MRTSTKALIALVPLVSVMAAVNTPVSSAAETTQDAQYPLPDHPGGDTDDLSNPLADAQRELRATALEAQL